MQLALILTKSLQIVYSWQYVISLQWRITNMIPKMVQQVATEVMTDSTMSPEDRFAAMMVAMLAQIH